MSIRPIRFFVLVVLMVFGFLGAPLWANVLGDMQTFAPNTDGLDFITVHSSRPLKKGFFAVGGHFSYAKDHLQVFNPLGTQEHLNYSDQLVEFDTDVSYALGKQLGVFLAVPTLLWQESAKDQSVDVEITRGVHAFRPGFKYVFSNDPEAFAFVGSVDIPNVQNSPYTGIDPRPIVNLEVAKNWKTSGRVTYGTNLGYRLREPTARPTDAQMFPLDDQVIFSLARSAPLFSKTGWVAEAFFSVPVDKDPYNKMVHAASADLLLGIKHRIRTNMNIDAGVTVEPFIDSQSPKFRAFAGLVYYFKPTWFDRSATPEPEETIVPAETVDQELAAMTDEGDIPGKASAPVKLGALKVSPQYVEVFEGSTVEFQAQSLNEPIVMELLSGSGIVYDSEFIYRAPLKAERARIRFTDAVGSTKIARVIVKPIPRADETLRIKNLKFVFAKAELIDESQKEIRRIVRVLRNKKVKRIIVEGHTDSVGSNRYNLELSEKRAKTVREILIDELYLKRDQVYAIGFGEERPVATNKTDAGRQRNRRVDLKVYYEK